MAVGLIESLVDSGLNISPEHIREGLRRVEWPCRMEVLQREPLLMVDGAHNPHSAGRIVEAVKETFPERRVALIVGDVRQQGPAWPGGGAGKAGCKDGDSDEVSSPKGRCPGAHRPDLRGLH